jgi:hypothetical protein
MSEEIEAKENRIQDVFETVNISGYAIQRRFQEGQRPDDFGLCSRCSFFHHQRREYGTELAICSYEVKHGVSFMPPSRLDPIKDCSGFYPSGQMDLYSMSRIATIIDIDKKGPIGFRK